MQQFVPTAVVVTCSECAWFQRLIGESALLAPIGVRVSPGGSTRARFWFRRSNQFLIPIKAASPSMDNVF